MKTETVVVTRHPALVEYLREIGLITSASVVISHATITDVKGKHVIGVLPLSLAVHAISVTEVPLDIPAELRGKELDLFSVRMFAGTPTTYTVMRSYDWYKFYEEACPVLDTEAYFGVNKSVSCPLALRINAVLSND